MLTSPVCFLLFSAKMCSLHVHVCFSIRRKEKMMSGRITISLGVSDVT